MRSIVGRFLEHSRVYYFENAGEREIYCGSADWMDRNLFRRVEVAFPVESPELQARVADESSCTWPTTCQAWSSRPDGTTPASPARPTISAQARLLSRTTSASRSPNPERRRAAAAHRLDVSRNSGENRPPSGSARSCSGPRA